MELFTLGDLYVSDFLKDGEEPRYGKVEMKMLFDETTREVRLEKSAPPESMYGRYWYRSGINQTMRNELKSIVDSVQSVLKLQDDDVWIDIACNDGTLLSYVPKNLYRIGVDPVEDSYSQESRNHADLIVQDYFSRRALNWSDVNAKVVTCIAMFYDLEDPDTFLQDVYHSMDKNGLFVCQMSYTPLMIEQLAFDNICHEHIYYYTLYTIKNRFAKNGFKIVDVQLNDINGGSFRVYAMRDDGDVSKFATQPYRDVCNFRIQSLLRYENQAGYNDPEIWKYFFEELGWLKSDVVSFVRNAKTAGKTIWGYGASTKGNTLLQYFGLDNTLIDGIAERSPYKFGLRTVGTNIPIYSEEEMRKVKPDYMLVLPWHFINEFCQREREYLAQGGAFIVPCPVFRVITKDDL